jgi:hypothetical protein
MNKNPKFESWTVQNVVQAYFFNPIYTRAPHPQACSTINVSNKHILFQFNYYYSVQYSKCRYPVFHVLDTQVLRINRPQTAYLSLDTFL